MPKITNQKHGTLSEAELVQIAALLIKGGYDVRRYKAKQEDKPNVQSKWHVEYEAQ